MMSRRVKGRGRGRNTISMRERIAKSKAKAALRSDRLEEEIIRDHQDVLQNIEFVLVAGYRQDSQVDDQIIAKVLKGAIEGEMPTDELVQSLHEGLDEIRQVRSDVSDELWRECIGVVLRSVHRHSSLKAGARGYLDFVSDFIA